MTPKVNETNSAKSQLRCRAHGLMAEWLAAAGGSLAITTYTSGRLVLVSSLDDRLHFRTQRFQRPMGIAIADNQLALVVRQQILLFRRQKSARNRFSLQRQYDTGRVDAHDVAIGERGLYFANTRFNCVARTSQKKRFLPGWQPPFIDGVVRGDRCHLNGIGMRDNRPAMATAFCATGHAGGWRDQNRFNKGVLIDIRQNRVVTEGLCMPHSPRWRQGHWWFCNSGQGLLSTFDPESCDCKEVSALPGFTRGLCLVANHALVGLSKIRRKHILDAPPVRERHQQIFAGVALVDLATGRQTGSLEFLNGGHEVYDVVFLPDTHRPSLMLPKPPTAD
jgi:uncharacterized protein (TIGR03032 family)